MMKLKKIHGDIYCFLMTFDPSTETVNILDLQGSGSESQLPQSARLRTATAEKHKELVTPTKDNSDRFTLEPSANVANRKSVSAKLDAPTAEAPKKQAPAARQYRPQDLLSRREAAAYLGVAEQTLSIWKCTGRQKLPYLKIGKLVKYKMADLDAFLDNRKHDPEFPGKQEAARKRSASTKKNFEF